MNDNLKISIVVPIYKVESYIEDTIESLLKQDLEPNCYEIILVNDGSPDKCKEICQHYAEKHKNVWLIDKENGGVSTARNAGLQLAKGEYIMFVDGDDKIEEKVLFHLYTLTTSHDLDIGLFSMRREHEKAALDFSKNFEQVVTGPELYLYHRKRTVDNSCPILYRRDFLEENNLTYTVGVPLLEDGEFLIRVMALAARSAFLEFPYLIRTTRGDSATGGSLRKSNKAFHGFLIAFENLYSFKKKHKLTGKQLVVVNQGLIKYITHAVKCSLFGKSLKNILKIKHRTERLKIKKIDPDGLSSSYSKYAIFYNIGFYPYVLYMMGNIITVRLSSIMKSKNGFGKRKIQTGI